MWVKITKPEDTKKLKVGDPVKVDGQERKVTETYPYDDYGFSIDKSLLDCYDVISHGNVVNNDHTIELWEEEILEPIQFGKQFFGYKIRVNPETSEMIQKAVFEAGGSWRYDSKEVENLGRPHLYIDFDGEIAWGNDEEYFNDYNGDDCIGELVVELEVFKSLKIVDTIPNKSEKDLQQEKLQGIITDLQKQLAWIWGVFSKLNGSSSWGKHDLWNTVDRLFNVEGEPGFKKEWIPDCQEHSEEIDQWLDNLFKKPETDKEKKLRELKEQYEALGKAIYQLEEEWYMCYQLTDGSYSTEYRIGDKFVVVDVSGNNAV